MIRSHKSAIARIFADLIKADRIINTGEMEYWSMVCTKYGIDKEIEIEAQSVSFAEALMSICTSGVPELKESLLEDCLSMTTSDGFCAHSEALIIMALILMLDDDQAFSVETISIPRANFNIDVATSLYIESEYDPPTNNAIRANYRSLFKEFQLVGFHFVYLPKIIEHYQETDPKLLRQILSFLAPSISETGIENVYQSLMRMTTPAFCKDLLCNKLGIDDLRDTYPSLLIKIGNSFVGEDAYANYVKIEVDEDILPTVQSFLDRFREILSSDVYVVNTSEEKDNQFHFHGFYKQLLDIFLTRKNIRSTIVIDPYKEEIFFPEIDAKASGLHRRERALYALLLCQGKTGLNFNQPKSSDSFAKYKTRMAKIQSAYRSIYAMFGGDPEAAPDLSQPEIRRPIISCLRRSLNNLKGLYNPQDYGISKNRDGVFTVNVDKNIVFVSHLGADSPVALTDSELYHRWENA